MRQEIQKWDNILELFFKHSSRRFTVREISLKTKVPISTVQRYLERLKKDGFVSKENKANITTYFKFKKALFLIDKMCRIGLIDYIAKELNPSSVIVFGSVRKGEYDNESDIDLFVESSVKKKVDLKVFEKRLGHGIQLFVESDIKKLHDNLFNNVVNGIKLYGSFKVR
jgi:predicted nucleotidyltransferase